MALCIATSKKKSIPRIIFNQKPNTLFHSQYDITHEEQRAQAKDDLICILAHMFTQKFVPINTIERPDKEAVSWEWNQLIDNH